LFFSIFYCNLSLVPGTFRQKGNMDIIVLDNYDEISKYAAAVIAELVKAKSDCVIGLASGITPIGTYKELIKLHNNGLDFSNVKTFNLDEYLGIGIDLEKPYNQDQSYARFMHEELFKHIKIKKENIHIPDGLTPDPEKYCAHYEEEIKRAGGIDLQLLGIGSDGHIAFNGPGSSLLSRTRVQMLTAQTLDDNYESFFKKAGIKRKEMPQFAITMGIRTILDSRHALMIASGIKKARIIAKALEGPVTSQITASAMQLHPNKATFVFDKEAASKLKLIRKN